RVCDELAVHQSDPQRADGTVERDARQAQRHGGAVHCQDVGIVLLVGGDREADDLNLVTKATGKEWADRPVNQPGRQRLFLRGRALPSEVPAGNPATRDRKSTRLNSSHDQISYAVFCLKKKTNKNRANIHTPLNLTVASMT